MLRNQGYSFSMKSRDDCVVHSYSHQISIKFILAGLVAGYASKVVSYRIFPVWIRIDACVPDRIPVAGYGRIIARPIMVDLMYLLGDQLLPCVWCLCEMCGFGFLLCNPDAGMFKEDLKKSKQSNDEIDDENEDEDEWEVYPRSHIGNIV